MSVCSTLKTTFSVYKHGQLATSIDFTPARLLPTYRISTKMCFVDKRTTQSHYVLCSIDWMEEPLVVNLLIWLTLAGMSDRRYPQVSAK